MGPHAWWRVAYAGGATEVEEKRMAAADAAVVVAMNLGTSSWCREMEVPSVGVGGIATYECRQGGRGRS